MLKKIFAFLMALLMLCSCGMQEEQENEPLSPEIKEEQVAEEKEPEEIPKEEEQPDFTEPVEPEIIAEHIAALNQARLEIFGTERNSDIQYGFYYKEENTEWGTVPDLVVAYGDETVSTEGFYYDFFERDAIEVTNFKTKNEVREYMSQWLAPEIYEMDGSGVDFNFMEVDGKLYLLRGGRGYGVITYGNTEIISETETEMFAKTYIYAMRTEETGTAEIKFEKIDGNWIIVSVTDNYY